MRREWRPARPYNVRLAWQDARGGSADVMMAPSVASDGNATYAALLDQRDGYKQLWLSQLTTANGATAWNPLTPFPGGGALHAVWS